MLLFASMRFNNYKKSILEIMPSLIKLNNPDKLTPQILYRNELERLSLAGELRIRLGEIDSKIKRVFNRVYLMGCGRSGTWLLTGLMSTYSDVDLVAKELAIEYFGIYETLSKVLIIKRDRDAYQRVEDIPDSIKILYIIRHPFDVLTSFNPNVSSRKYYIRPHRWLSEMMSLRYLMDYCKTVKVVRYEDLVTNPEQEQEAIARFLEVEISSNTIEICNQFKAPPEAESAMHGLRSIDTNSMNRYLNNLDDIEYLKKINPRISLVLDWVSQKFNYQTNLD